MRHAVVILPEKMKVLYFNTQALIAAAYLIDTHILNSIRAYQPGLSMLRIISQKIVASERVPHHPYQLTIFHIFYSRQFFDKSLVTSEQSLSEAKVRKILIKLYGNIYPYGLQAKVLRKLYKNRFIS